MAADRSKKLVQQVVRRQRLVRLGVWTYRAFLAAAVLYAVVLAIYFLGLLPKAWFPDWTLLLVPAIAALAGLFLHRAPSLAESAKTVDDRIGTKDLYLTVVELDHAPGEYKPLVVRDAEDKAPSVRPAAVTPFEPWPKVGTAALAMGVLLAGVLWLEPLDLFGEQAQRQKLAERQKRLQEDKKLTVKKMDRLKDKPLKAERTKPVEAAIDDLKNDFNQMKPDLPKDNHKKLVDQQSKLTKLLARNREESLRDTLKSRPTSRAFNRGNDPKSQNWKNELDQGKTDGLQKEVNELKKLADEIAAAKDPAKKQRLQEDLKDRLRDIKDFVEQQAGSDGLNKTIQQAAQQLDMAQMDGLGKDAIDALQESLQLSDLQLQQLAQNMRDAKSLQEALDTLKLARQLNQMQPLDGQMCKSGNCQGLGDYKSLYLKMCQGQGGGQGLGLPGEGMGGDRLGLPTGQSNSGMGGPGQGRGGVAPEDPNQQMSFVDDKVESRMQAGRILMKWKSQDMADKGEATTEYLDAIEQVKQGVSEAIVSEDVPPGTRDVIRKYFDGIEQTVDDSHE